MKIFLKLATLIAGMCITLTALGGAGSGGTIPAKTKFLLQSFALHEAILTVDELTNIPETVTTPLLKIDEFEYKDLLIEVQLAEAEKRPCILPLPLEDGSFRYFTFKVVGELGEVPFFIHVEEVKAVDEQDAK